MITLKESILSQMGMGGAYIIHDFIRNHYICRYKQEGGLPRIAANPENNDEAYDPIIRGGEVDNTTGYFDVLVFQFEDYSKVPTPLTYKKGGVADVRITHDENTFLGSRKAQPQMVLDADSFTNLPHNLRSFYINTTYSVKVLPDLDGFEMADSLIIESGGLKTYGKFNIEFTGDAKHDLFIRADFKDMSRMKVGGKFHLHPSDKWCDPLIKMMTKALRDSKEKFGVPIKGEVEDYINEQLAGMPDVQKVSVSQSAAITRNKNSEWVRINDNVSLEKERAKYHLD